MSPLRMTSSHKARPVLAIDMTALWHQKTTGIQRVIRETTPYLAAAVAKRGWEIVLVRKIPQGLAEITRWWGDFDQERVEIDLNRIAEGWSVAKSADANPLVNLLRRATRLFQQADMGRRLGLRFLERMMRPVIPASVRHEFRGWRTKHQPLCTAADAYLSFAGGILPVAPPEFAPPERTIIVIHDLIPLHLSQHYPPEITQAFASNISALAFGPLASEGRFVTASRHVAAEIDELFQSLARKRVNIDVVQWGYDRKMFFPDPDPKFRRELGIPHDALLVAAVSTQDPRKRFADIQQAVARLNAYAVFLGKGQPRREGNAIYLGHVSDAEVRRAYSTADVVVNWSGAEGFGLPTIEALACGAKVVIPPDNPTSLDVGGKSVIVADRADVPSLCSAICDAFLSESLVPDLSRFDWANSSRVLESLLWPANSEPPKAAHNPKVARAKVD
jgi:glycosyltransferase involved in cell wall biosynthesis